MGLIIGSGDTKVLVVNKKEYIGFNVSPQFKADFVRAITELGQYTTYTDFFVAQMRDYIVKHQTEKKEANHV